MYPGTNINWYDQSAIQTPVVESVDNSPLYLHFSSFDRGPEDLRTVKGQQFYQLYGNKMNFDKHGQPAIQAARIIDAGGTLLIKRLVAKDATLANLVAVATVQSNITAIKAEDGEEHGKSIEEILTGETSTKEYVEKLEILSAIGKEDNTTELTVTPTLVKGNKYFWKKTNADVLIEKGIKIDTTTYNAWDGKSNIAVVDGTKIILVEADANNEAQKCGIIAVTSKLPHMNTTSEAPTNGLNALYVTSKEGTAEGTTAFVVSPAKLSEDNKYYYKIQSGTVNFPEPDHIFTEKDMKDWTLWDGTSDITIADKSVVVVGEFSIDTDKSTYTALKAASIVVSSKLPADTRTSASIEPVIPSEDKYIVSKQENSVKWSVVNVANCKTYEEIMAAAASIYSEEVPTIQTNEDETVTAIKTVTYPMFVATDNGRGVSNKAIKIVPDYSQSKDMSSIFYNVFIYDGTTSLETCICTLRPDVIFNDTLYGINKDTAVQVLFGVIPGMYDKYVKQLSELTGFTVSKLQSCDTLYMTNNKGSNMSPYITLDTDSIDFQSVYGVELKCGDNGEFGDAPFGTKPYIDAAIELLDGTYDSIIWDVDTYKIAAIFDANYPIEIKQKLAEFVAFREDGVYFRDYGVDIASYAAIVNYRNQIADHITNEKKKKFIGDYYTTYEIRDPETKVRERVTMMYDFSAVMVDHFARGCFRPAAGVANNMILSNAIEGTINFTPRNTPSGNQKALLDDLRVNYAIFENGRCVVQSLYTSQDNYTELSFLNNVLAIQEVVRSIRTSCPKQRFTFVTSYDFSSYADAVNAVLKGFASNFAELRFEYQQDKLKAAQKIFQASIFFKFNTWAQTEEFDVYALGND